MKIRHDKDNPVDDLFYRALKDHETSPSAENREMFLHEAAKLPVRKFRLSNLLVWSVVIALLTGGGLLYFQTTKISGSYKQTGKTKISGTSERSDIYESTTKANQTTITESPVKLSSGSRNQSPVKSSLNQSIILKKISLIKQSDEVKNSIDEDAVGPPASMETKDVIKLQPSETKETSEIAAKITERSADSGKVISDHPVLLPEPSPKKPHLPLNIRIGLSYTPEWMFNTLAGEKFVNNFGIEGRYFYGPFSISTGAGLSITEGSNEILAETNPFLGDFQKLDSINFHWDFEHFKLVPVIFTSETDVYDTIKKYNYRSIEKRYTYLQIPLLLGYDFFSLEKIKIGFRTGAVLSVLIRSKTLSPSYDPGRDRVILINKITPERIQLNWQVVGGLNCSVKLYRKLNLEIEPQVRYYFNSVYEKAEINKFPWSAGFRTALMFDL